MEKETNKTVITQEEFDKKVDIAFAYLTYWDRMKDDEARRAAVQEVREKFVVKRAG